MLIYNILMSFTEENNKKCSYPECNKKIKLTDFPCKCGKYFCKMHIFSSDHFCSYDFKEEDKKSINIKKLECKSKKIDKI